MVAPTFLISGIFFTHITITNQYENICNISFIIRNRHATHNMLTKIYLIYNPYRRTGTSIKYFKKHNVNFIFNERVYMYVLYIYTYKTQNTYVRLHNNATINNLYNFFLHSKYITEFEKQSRHHAK